MFNLCNIWIEDEKSSFQILPSSATEKCLPNPFNIFTDSIYFRTDNFIPVLNLSVVWNHQRRAFIQQPIRKMKLSFLIFGFQQLVEAQFPGRYAHEMVNLHRELKQGTVLNTLNYNLYLPLLVSFYMAFNPNKLVSLTEFGNTAYKLCCSNTKST